MNGTGQGRTTTTNDDDERNPDPGWLAMAARILSSLLGLAAAAAGGRQTDTARRIGWPMRHGPDEKRLGACCTRLAMQRASHGWRFWK